MKKKKLLIFLLAAVSAVSVSTALVTSGCGGNPEEKPPVVQDETPKVTINYDNGTPNGTVEATKVGDDWQITQPAAPTKDGYAFGGWYSDSACTKEVSFPLIVTGNTTIYAKWTAETPSGVEVTGVALNKTETSIMAGATESLTATVSPENATDKTVTWSSSDDEIATVVDGVVTGVSVGTATITVTTANNKTATCTVTVTEAVTTISTKAEFLAFRTAAELSGKYVLGADIDLAGEVLEASSSIIGEGVTFDGQGYTISNATYADAAVKTGLLCAQIQGGTVTNVKFLNCSVTAAGETCAIVAGLCEGGTISKVEFNSCAVDTTNTYAGLIFGRNTKAATINISEITVKNGCFTKCAQYGGLLVGDLVGGTTVNFKNLDVDGEFKGSFGNGSFIAGCTRENSIVSVENAVLNVNAPVVNSIGIFSGNASVAKLTVKNVLILGSNITNLYQISKAPVETDISELYTVEGVTVDGATGTGENTVAWLTAKGFDFENVWTAEGDGYRLKASSTNVKSADATLTSLKLNSANATTRIKKGGTFSSAGLLIMGVYSDGVQLVGSSKASPYVQVDALDAEGNIVASLVGTTGTDKKDAAITFTTNEITVAFASIRIASNTSGKSVGITTASIIVE